METIEEIFNNGQYNDMRGAVNKSKEKTREYKARAKSKYKIPSIARFKCKLYFLDGNSKTFYSYDFNNGVNNSSILDEWNGLMKLMRMIDKFKGTYKTALIWANLDAVSKTQGGKFDFEVLKITRYTNEVKKIGFLTNGSLDIERIKTRLAKEWELNNQER